MRINPLIPSIVRLGEVALPDGVELDSQLVAGVERVRLTARRDLTDLATRRYSQPVAHVSVLIDGQPSFLGFADTQFALPVVAGPSLDFDFNPAPNLRAPPVLGVLLACVGQRHVMLAPIDHPHEQVICVADGGLVWGWHGDLDEARAGFSTTLGIYEGVSAQELLRQWGDDVRTGRPRRRRATNPITSHLSYWTDNGAAYWYRTEPGRTIGASIAETVESLRADESRFAPSNWIRGAISTRRRDRSPRSAIPTTCHRLS